ncbi:conjugal transfer protein TrbH [Rhizobium lusitanum]|uniref:conjugal transfer protein TrbH n=1 Tax=Rhizobium lusitanum TaxID=293958 RepID=UPI00157405A3|nr:conjugal transfer protein TrbH [Rhizobium lusitanum]NTJ11682.1 conjugal transfer protein TrbH [Rhizobium lusitanum]
MGLASFRSIAAPYFLALTLAGCQAVGPEALVASNGPSEISGPAASAIAGDMVSRLAEQIGPGTATIVLKQDGAPFGKALEMSLKGWGYAVVTDQKTGDKAKTIALAYVISRFDGQILARLSTASVEIGRAYSSSATGATPVSPLSVMQRG